MTTSAKMVAKRVDVPAPAMAGADGAHGRKRRRKRPPCAIPGCTARPRYVCVHYESGSPNDPSRAHDAASAAAAAAAAAAASIGHRFYIAGAPAYGGGKNSNGKSGSGGSSAAAGDEADDLLWFCKAHKCRLCVRVDDDDGRSNGAGAVRHPAGAVDVARIADTARAALVRLWETNGGAGDPHIAYGFHVILELCGPDHGEVRVCACGHPLSSHYVGFGRCMDCPDDSQCPAMRRRRDGPAAQPTAAPPPSPTGHAEKLEPAA